MLTLDPAALRRDFAQVLKQYYPPTTADTLAVLHAQMHLDLAKGMASRVPPPEDTDKLVRALPRPQTERVLTSMRNAHPTAARGRGLSAEALYEEVRSMFASLGPDRTISFQELRDEFWMLSSSRRLMHETLQKLITAGLVVRTKKTKGARYTASSAPLSAEPNQA